MISRVFPILLFVAVHAFAADVPIVPRYDSRSEPFDVIEKLGPHYSIRIEADSWDHLLEKAKPTFSWNGRDLLWITEGANDRPQFTLEQAYSVQPKDQPARWVLLNERPGRMPAPTFEDRSLDDQIYLRKRVFTLSDTIPGHSDTGKFDGGGYAVSKAANPRAGTVYEICWDEETGGGTDYDQVHKLLYLLKDNSDGWHFLGEGPRFGTGASGSNSGYDESVRTRVDWPEPAAGTTSVEIHFVLEHEEHEGGTEDTPWAKPDTSFTTLTEFIPFGSNTPKLASAWMAGSMGYGKPVHSQES